MAKGINPNLHFKSRKLRTQEEYVAGLQSRDRFMLSEVLTLVESSNPFQRSMGEAILNTIDTSSISNTIRIGITGSPGAGKSTFIEALGSYLTSLDKKVAVLAVDPSSTRSQGSILGDKTRMSQLSVNPLAFVRPTASSNVLGGVARATKESIALCEAAGFDVILIESVGVGQSETELADLVDMYLLLLLPGGGDSVQGIKRGVVELADILVINKYDGDQKVIAEQSKRDFAAAIRLFHHEILSWNVPVELCSALESKGIEKIWEKVKDFIDLSQKEGFFQQKRTHQEQKWIANQIKMNIDNYAKELFGLENHLKGNAENLELNIFKKLQIARQKIENDYQKFNKKKSEF